MPRLPLVPLALFALLTGSLTAFAQETTPGAGFDPVARFPAHVLAGSCEQPGEVVYTLAEGGFGLPLPIEAGTESVTATYVGPNEANPAIVSTTTLDAALTAIVDGGHVVDAHRAGGGDEEESRIVCGAVGGFLAGDDLVFGLQEANDSGYRGTAWLHDNGDQTTMVTLFLVSPSGAADAASQTQAAAMNAGDTTDTTEVPAAVADAEPLAPAPAALDVTGAVVENRRFASEEIRLLAGIPSVMHVVNGDERDYRFRVVDLITTTELPAGELTVIELTSPTTGIHEGQLLAANQDDVLDVIPVIINAYEPFP